MNPIYYQVYDAVYSKRPLSEDIADLCLRFSLKKDTDVLDFGCGTGLYSKVLEERFDRVFGYDIDNELKSFYQRNASRSIFLDEVPGNGHIGAVFSFFNVFNYLKDQHELDLTTSRLSAALSPLGYLIIDILSESEMRTGRQVNKRSVITEGQHYDYLQEMHLDTSGRLEFIETILENEDKLTGKAHSLFLWKSEAIISSLKQFGVQYKGSVPSPFIKPHQVRLLFQKEEK